ncbi:transposase [Kitasatospora sp. NPDC088346]|uniref:transposase n=1 Tax=Kitasatospora sp. NPDC088346 TaxID=3364073 RepID=UPI0038120D36
MDWLARVRPQGGGTANLDDEAVLAAIVYVLRTGCAWRHLPPCFGLSKSTVHRRFTIWTRDGLWGRLRQAVLERLAAAEALDVSRMVVDSVVGISAGNGHSQHGLIPLVQVLQMKHDPERGLHYRPAGSTRTRPMAAPICGDGCSRSCSGSGARALSRARL